MGRLSAANRVPTAQNVRWPVFLKIVEIVVEVSADFWHSECQAMSSPPAKTSGKLDEKQRKALVSLLADDDPAVHRTVRQKILSYGPIAATWMREHSLSNDPVLRRHAQDITNYFM